MRTTRLLLLTGTILPALILTGPSLGRTGSEGSGTIVVAQGGPGGEPRGGGDGPRGGGDGPRGGGPAGGPARSERAPAERPEPRQERAPAPDRPAPERPARQERVPAERPEPRQERERAPERPAQRPDRSEPREERAPAERPAQQRPERSPPERQPDRAPAERQPERAPAPPAARERSPERPAAPDRPAVPEPSRRNPEPATPPAQRQAPQAPSTPTPPTTTGPATPGTAQPSRPTQPIQPQTAPTPAPNAAPGVPGRPITPPGGARAPIQDAPGATAPNAAPGVPGRPVTAPQGREGPSESGSRTPGSRRPGAEPGSDPAAVPVAPGAPPAKVQGVQPPPVPVPGREDGRREGSERREDGDRRDGFNAPGRPGYIQGGFRDDDDTRDFDRVRRDRREYSEDGRTYIREPGRIIVRDRDNYYIRHDENERFRDLDRGRYRSERRGSDTVTYLERPGGEQIVTIVDDDGRLLRRSRRFRDGREVIIIDNAGRGPRRPIYENVVDLPPPDIRIPRERYVVEYERADERAVYEALSAPPVVAVDQRYTLDQVRYSPQLRARMRSVDIDTVTFDSGSFTVTPDQAARLSTIASAINQSVRANPQEVFLIEGYTDAVGADIDNLSLSDRRAQSVATVLTQNFQVPPENLTTQGYGEQYLKVNTQVAARENRRVTVRRITPLIQQQSQAAEPPR